MSAALVYVNGVLQMPTADYVVDPTGHITLGRAPSVGSSVTVQTPTGGARYIGDGVTTTFTAHSLEEQWAEVEDIHSILRYAYSHQEHPAIKDALERLEVVVKLVRDDPIR